MATRDPSSEIIELVADLCRRAGRPAEEAELRGALREVGPREEAILKKLAGARGGPPARPLGPHAWVDLARGMDPKVAAARELSGYYALLAERDALAAIVQSRAPEKAARLPPAAPEVPRPARSTGTSFPGRAANSGKRPARAASPQSARRVEPTVLSLVEAPGPEPLSPAVRAARGAHLLGLFAYHRDAPLVARALRMSMAELELELDDLKLRRKVNRLVRGLDSDLPAASAIEGAPSGPSVRRRAKADAAAPEAAPVNAATGLRTVLHKVGARRAVLAVRLAPAGEPLTEKGLLALFREHGLEREFTSRERDLVRELYETHRSASSRVAKELHTSSAALKALVVELGLSRELDGKREHFRRTAREKKWPVERIEQVLHERDYLEEIGLLEPLEKEVATRVRLLWRDLRARSQPLEELQRALRLTANDARGLQRLLDLR